MSEGARSGLSARARATPASSPSPASTCSRAEVVVYDRLVSRRLVGLAPTKAERIFVGKHAPEEGGSGFSQRQINELLVAKAREGKRVVRLKGGDPFVFGRGGEEAEALLAAGIPFEVVPGVTSAIAAPAYAGIPVTHRRLSSSFTVVTGHEDPEKAESAVDWRAHREERRHARHPDGRREPGRHHEAARRWRPFAGRAVAVIRRGTTPEQQRRIATIADIATARRRGRTHAAARHRRRPRRAPARNPPLVRQPALFGKRVLVTRAPEQAGVLSHALAEAGAEPIELPAIEIVPRIDRKALAAGPRTPRRRQYDWLVFGSANGVDIFFDELRRERKDARALGRARVCAIGPATAIALVAAWRPRRPRAGALSGGRRRRGAGGAPYNGASRALAAGPWRSSSAGHRPGAPGRDRRRGAAVQRRRSERGRRRSDVAASRRRNRHRYLREPVSGAQPAEDARSDGESLLEKPLIACIGPVTAAAARRAGLRVDVEAPEHTIDGLMAALRGLLPQ